MSEPPHLKVYSLLSTLANSADDNLVKLFSYILFREKQDLTFRVNFLLYEIQILFSRQNKKTISICRLLKVLPRVLIFKHH